MKRPENIPADKWQQIESQIYNNQKIEAIKTYRSATGLGLKESKDAIDQLSVEMKKENPLKFAPQKPGCGTTLFFLSLIPCIYYLWH
jgi:hypothetical protein